MNPQPVSARGNRFLFRQCALADRMEGGWDVSSECRWLAHAWAAAKSCAWGRDHHALLAGGSAPAVALT